MNAGDVANAVLSQNLDAPAGQIGQPPAGGRQSLQLPIDTLGRLTQPEQFGDIIIKATQVSSLRPTSVTAPSTPAPAPLRSARSHEHSQYRRSLV